MKAGLNLYSVRNLIKTEEDFLKTANSLKEAGYSYLQYSGAPFDAERIQRVCDRSGLPVYLTHVPMERIVEDTEKLMEEHASFGCKYIGLGMMPREIIFDEEKMKKQVALLNAAGEKMEKNGFRFFYHHHHFEFAKHSGQTVLDYMLENAPYIHFTVDTYWLQYGGVDIVETIKKMKGRIACAHLKDYQISKVTSLPEFAPVGDGTIDFKRVVQALKEAGTEYFFVEQDNAADLPDTLGQVARSISYIEKEI